MRKNWTQRWYAPLMLASLVLLLGFLSYWLGQVYQKEKKELAEEVDHLVDGTIHELQDSLFRRNLEVRSGEKTAGPSRVVVLNTASATGKTSMTIRMDTFGLIKKEGGSGAPRSNFIFKRIRNHQGKPYRGGGFRQVVEAAMRQSPAGQPLVLQWREDSVRVRAVRQAIAQELKAQKMSLTFTLRRVNEGSPLDSIDGLFAITPANFPPTDFFLAQFAGEQRYLLGQIFPQILFALFLLAFTGLSFAVLYRSLRREQHLSKVKNDFISNITHELKTPIATVSVALEALNNFNALSNPERTREYLEISRHELNRLSILVDRVLKMSMFEQKAFELQPERFDLKAAIDNILASLKLQFEKNQARVHFSSPAASCWVEGDPIHLTNVVYNLLDNALKYSQGQPEIAIELQESAGQVVLTVADRGIGIPAEYQGRIFEQFFRVPNENRHNVKGHGLGLSYVAGVIQRHGGRIAVESNFGEGTRFAVFLPQALRPAGPTH